MPDMAKDSSEYNFKVVVVVIFIGKKQIDKRKMLNNSKAQKTASKT